MKVFYVCDCCDEVFNLVEPASPEAIDPGGNLTDENGRAIISDGLDNERNYYVHAVCPDCQEDIWLGAQTSFYRAPVIN